LTAKAVAPSLPTPAIHHDNGLQDEGEAHSIKEARRQLMQSQNYFALTTEADLEELLALMKEQARLLVVDYYAPWCRVCQRLLRQIQSLAKDPQFHNVAFASVDFEQSRSLCKAKKVDKLPTLEIYRGDELKQRWSGASKKRLLERIGNEVAAGERIVSESGDVLELP